LSHLCHTALLKMTNQYGATIIFPSQKNCSETSLINRFLAVCDETNPDNLNIMGREIENEVKMRFLNIGEQILSRLNIPKPEGYDQQIDKYWSIFWLFESFDEGAYKAAYHNIENRFGAIKNVRNFDQLEQSPCRRCAITGEHTVLFYRQGNKRAFVPDYAVALPDTVPKKYMESAEMLGAIAFVKRCAEVCYQEKTGYKHNFPSTAEIALMPLLEKYKNELPSLDHDPELIFDWKNGRPKPKNVTAEEWRQAKKTFAFFKGKEEDLTAYYALIHFDGDNMGKWLGGDYLAIDESLEQFQQGLSNQLVDFAKDASTQILCLPRGITVYAGGDDFLGFISLKDLFKVMNELRARFDKIDLHHFIEKKPTFSAGVVIAHYKAPLGEVLNWARRMEREAKNLGDEKNAFALASISTGSFSITFWSRWARRMGFLPEKMLAIYVT